MTTTTITSTTQPRLALPYAGARSFDRFPMLHELNAKMARVAAAEARREQDRVVIERRFIGATRREIAALLNAQLGETLNGVLLESEETRTALIGWLEGALDRHEADLAFSHEMSRYDLAWLAEAALTQALRLDAIYRQVMAPAYTTPTAPTPAPALAQAA